MFLTDKRSLDDEYKRFLDDEITTPLERDGEEVNIPATLQTTQRARHLGRQWLAGSHVLVAIVTYILTRLWLIDSMNCTERLSSFMSTIDRSLHEARGNIAFEGMNTDEINKSWNNFTVSAEIGKEQIESWWLDLGTYTKPVLVPERYAKDFGFDPQRHAIVRPDDADYGPGEVPYAGYPASIEVMHKFHCLNLLRQGLWYNHEYYRSVHGKPWAQSEHDLQRHMAHCVDIFRQKIICEAEIDLVPFENSMTEHRRNDWSMPRKCRNFESVRRWLAEHQWSAGDPNFYLDDSHPAIRNTVVQPPEHTMEELWRGY